MRAGPRRSGRSRRSAGSQPATDMRPQQERVEHQPGRVRALGQRAQRADEQQELPQRRLLLLRGEPLGGLEHRGAGGVAG